MQHETESEQRASHFCVTDCLHAKGGTPPSSVILSNNHTETASRPNGSPNVSFMNYTRRGGRTIDNACDDRAQLVPQAQVRRHRLIAEVAPLFPT